MGTVLFRERLTKLQWLAVAVTFAGLVITVIRYRQIPWIALVIGGSFAVYGALKKQVRSDAAVSTFVETLDVYKRQPCNPVWKTENSRPWWGPAVPDSAVEGGQRSFS